MEFKDLLQAQQKNGEEIEALHTNWRKASDHRKTVEYTTSRLEKLEELWTEFKNRHDEISQQYQEGSSYNKDEHFELVQGHYNELRAKMHERQAQLLGTKPKSTIGTAKNDNVKTSTQTPPRATKSDGIEIKVPSRAPPPPPAIADMAHVYEIPHPNPRANSSDDEIKRFGIKQSTIRRTMMTMASAIDDGAIQRAKLMQTNLEKQWESIYALFEEIQMLTDVSAEYVGAFDQLQHEYFVLLDKLNEQQLATTVNTTNVAPVALKLKPIEIPTFGGDIKMWPTFSELFTTLIKNNRSLDNVQKMQYLKTNVRGDAAKLINKLEIIGSNFESAWELLQDRYNNKRAIMNMHLDTLFSQANVQSESAFHLRKLHDISKECMSLLSEVTTDQIIIFALTKKMDRETHKMYEQSLKNPKEPQELEEFFKFLENRCQVLESIRSNKNDQNKNGQGGSTKSYYSSNLNGACPCCEEKHALKVCPKFKNLKVNERSDIVKKNKLCRNCLKGNHETKECFSKIKCSDCGEKHHQLLHYKKQQESKSSFASTTDEKLERKVDERNVTVHVAAKRAPYGVLLATALIKVKNGDGWNDSNLLRALIDQGSMSSFITENAVQRLRLPRMADTTKIKGIGGTNTRAVKGCTTLVFSARYPSSFQTSTEALILNKLTSELPDKNYFGSGNDWPHLNELVLADPNFRQMGKIDVILGAEVFTEILLAGLIKSKISPGPMAQETELGWIISGATAPKGAKPKENETVSLVAVNNIDDNLRKFWEIEEISTNEEDNDENVRCEKHFAETHKRNEDGKYVVSLPFKNENKILGNSKRAAMSQLFQLENRFKKNIELKTKYTEVINEYIASGHMEKCTNKVNDEKGFYLPHHAVFKESTTTQLRVVYDASRKTSTGISLNDTLIIGPRLQDELFNIIIRFRTHRIAFSADIAKMYRQIWIDEKDMDYQRILWRENENEPIQEYRLKTVTFGVSSAPYLAVKTLIQHAQNESKNHLEASKIIQRDFYMDDLISGCDSEDTAIKLQSEIVEVLQRGGFPLRKWTSNSVKLLQHIPEHLRESAPIKMDADESTKTLGLLWYHISDQFGFKIDLPESSTKITKRTILSEISKLYDPLGLLAPVIINAKILIQKLWLQALEWDEIVPTEIAKK